MTTPERRSPLAGLAAGALAGLLAHGLALRSLVSFWHDDFFLVPLAAVTFALLWRTRLRAALAATVVGLGALWLAVAFTPLSSWLARGLVRREAPRAADAVYVLASDIQSDGEPTGTAESRLLHGLELIGQGYASTLVVSEIHGADGAYAAIARALLAHLKLQPELVAVGPVGSTREEAVEVARLSRERGWRTILLVTSPAHSRRAAATFEQVGLAVVSSPCVETQYDLESLNHPNDRLSAFGHLTHERVGLWMYRRRGWLR